MEMAHAVFRLAAAGDAVALEQLFHEQPLLINSPDYDGNMPVHLAALSGSVECVQVCLDALRRREDLDMQTELARKNHMNKDVITCAVISDSMECLLLLIDHGAKTDYRYCSEVPPLVEALRGSDVEMTRFLLETLDVDFERSRMDQYWFAALQADLSVTLAHYKLLKAHAVPYGIGEFEELCLTILEWDPGCKNLEDFLIYLCTDAVDRWFVEREEVVRGIRRISSFVLRKLVPVNQSLCCVRRLQLHGLFQPPHSARAWLRVLSDWGLPPLQIPSPQLQDRLIHDLLSLFDKHCPGRSQRFIHVLGLAPLVLYFATLALKFPSPGWLDNWSVLCAEADFLECNLATLFDLHTVRHSRSASHFFWYEVFPFALARSIAYVDTGQLSMSVCHEQLRTFLDHILINCPSMRPQNLSITNDNLFLNLLSHFPASSKVPGHELFVRTVAHYILPWFLGVHWKSVSSGCLVTATVHALSHPLLLESILDFSPSLAHNLISNIKDWPHRVYRNMTPLFDCLLLAYTETQLIINTIPDTPMHMLSTDHSTIPSTSPVPTVMAEWFRKLKTQPCSLSHLSKQCIRVHLRRCQLVRNSVGCPQTPLSQLIVQLPIPQGVQQWLISSKLR
ncbi:Ankyrin repeat protein [Paragonimus skrjabini miyazakii]|uniref:Ankyrin repeat protein n=1 Tax=Paragonimus skrjabini miyazakii TaxID=59628 RepID=A0A8S9YUT4_9TREM|nr:Ankyrin repeat protein [Paragonimus skrjabini miyazakii]